MKHDRQISLHLVQIFNHHDTQVTHSCNTILPDTAHKAILFFVIMIWWNIKKLIHKNTNTHNQTTNISSEVQRGPGQLDIHSGELELRPTSGSLFTFFPFFAHASLLRTVFTVSFSAKQECKRTTKKTKKTWVTSKSVKRWNAGKNVQRRKSMLTFIR